MKYTVNDIISQSIADVNILIKAYEQYGFSFKLNTNLEKNPALLFTSKQANLLKNEVTNVILKNSISAIISINTYEDFLKLKPKKGKISIKAKNNSIIITDNGCGIKKEHLKHIFKPGFTTRTTEGYGLTLAQRAIKKLKGSIEIKPQLIGTKAIINLK